MKSGFISIIGKTNAGKSTLINLITKNKISICTPKPQTTRFNIKGIITTETSQMIFTDTPGVHLPKTKMGEYMMKGVEGAIKSVDVVIYLVDASKPKIDVASENIMKEIVGSKTKTKLIKCKKKKY